MKLFFMSDIHGSLDSLKKSIECFRKEKASHIIILGDILYHGPRNELPKDYNPKEVAKILNRYKDIILSVRGNCDAEVEQMVLEFPITAEYNNVLIENKRLFITHGHIYSKENMPVLKDGDVFISGHTHIPSIEKYNGITMINPGSIGIPKGGSNNSYGILENNMFTIKSLNRDIILKEYI